MEGRFSVKIVDGPVVLRENGNATNGNLKSTSTTCLHPPTQSTPKRKKSLVQMTREALPRLENYRNSRRALKRPSLGELHGGEDNVKEANGTAENLEAQIPSGHGIKLGWIQGVLIPCLLNIWGVMLFLRLSWVVAQSGIWGTMLIIAISAIVCVITTLSLSAISTNGEVKGGGIYYIISRSLGPEFGASVGVVFAFANAVAASMNTIGFCNSLNDLLSSYDLKIIDGDLMDVRLVGCIALLVMVIICAVGMEWESKAQNFLIAIILGAIVDFIVGTSMGPQTQKSRAEGFNGFSYETFKNNFNPSYRKQDGIEYDFFQVFAIFFPSVTGIQAGANISGDLKDPASSIPKGTLLALLLSMISYALFVIFAGGAGMRDASGSVEDLLNGTLTDCVKDLSCHHGLFNSYSMMQLMSAWGPLIYAGCFAATLSTALTNLLSVPRLLQALGIDRIYPGLIFFSKGYGKTGEPYRGYVLTFFISCAFVLIADLNAIAPLISNFYLASYALINFCTFHAALIKPLGWRPTFKYYNTWLSLAGFFMCVVIMFLINWQSSLITFIVILALYLIVVYRKPDVNWGSSTQAQTYKTALTTTHRLINIGEHVKNYEPQILILCGSPHVRPPLLDFANMITKNNSLLIVGEILEKKLSYRARSSKRRSAYEWFRQNKIKAFYSVVDGITFEQGSNALIQASGIGRLAPNVLMMGYKNDWMISKPEDLTAYFNVLHSAFDNRLSVAILRVPDGLDYSRITEEEDATHSTDITYSQPPSRADLRPFAATRMMHADSNLNISHIDHSVSDSVQSITVLNGVNVNKKGSTSSAQLRSKKKTAIDKILFTSPTGKQLPASVLESMSMFRKKQGKGIIDVWWLYDDGGLTMLLPYIISCRQDWINCKLRVFALTSNQAEIETDKQHMADLLMKFRLKYYSLEMVQISDKPKASTIEFFDNLIEGFLVEDATAEEGKVTELELAALQEKTYRQLRLRELLLENSKDSNLIVMSLPMPRKGTVSAPLYMAWLEALTKDLPPYLLIRGNQQSVLTFYS
ncbi:PREDICTED: bumetanide-sensitive sodium-(potassium)-chloride cotransporter [Nicrophorus vespilloides]|uniref:Bumetanide-sensitive sodium-(Potassium)-chloride cotransporter n=1 Tax=Nicrophorus vespilloides TaxID=110193 RepID=A0ABM1N0V5_NICVS|nr:PREDICTED: bumetanide-sensitive sodium-(potassium)-chloride cotransporter [Nicrophorus vespilloides]